MYGVPNEDDVQFLLGRTLQQVRFGQYEIVLLFDNEVTITIQCSYSVEANPDSGSPHVSSHVESLVRLLGTKIIAVRRHDASTMILTFQNAKLSIRENDAPYESFVITAPCGTFVV